MIEKAKINHLKDIVGIETECFDTPWSYESFLNEINNNVSSNWVYLKNNNVLGYLFGWVLEKDFQINNIAVKSCFRRNGLAYKMIKNCIDVIDLDSMVLEVSEFNESAILLYEGIGFKKNGLRKKYYSDGSDAILYKMDLL
ncbi:MAG: ribosomal-protein-alanine N-acetyltransferase [Candidatus Marinimicrobia bacterium]|nr:ribosomal-protein-alanine N-acetyltransferase [Candidatus Neomarinimicrobiota bacterium]|tara:strand:+ start:5749 stop:6171 length:423 start_codon:yes stop_codon:yes gene_type:complete